MAPISLSAAVLGVRGKLGHDLLVALRAHAAFVRADGYDLPEADITRIERLRDVLHRGDVVFNCAALTDVDACEGRSEEAFAVNGAGAGHVAEVARAMNAHLIHVSTDYVFDGRKKTPYVEDDAPAPLSVYGASKLDGERRVQQCGGRWTIVRTAWLYGRYGPNLVDRVMRMARERGAVCGVTDQVGSPTWTKDLAAAMIVLALRGETGIFHAVNAGACSRFEQIRFAVECAGIRARVTEATSSAFPRPATPPAYSPLSVEKLHRVTGHRMRPWQEALREYLCEKETA